MTSATAPSVESALPPAIPKARRSPSLSRAAVLIFDLSLARMLWSRGTVFMGLLVGLAVVDALATRRYWLTLYRQIKDDHQAKLRRDLAVYRQHQEQTRGGRLRKRLDGSSEDTPIADE